MISRRAALMLMATGPLAPCCGPTPARAGAGPRSVPIRIAYLTSGGASARTAWLDALRDGMREFGYEDGRNLVLDIRGADGRLEHLPKLAAELLAARPDVLLVSTTPAGIVAKAATTKVPIVMVSVGDPVGVGLVDNLARPGGNITGIMNGAVELAGKRVEVLKRLVPDAQRVAVLVNPGDAIALRQIQGAQAAARALGISLDPMLHVRNQADLEPAIRAAAQTGAKAALRLVDAMATDLRQETVRLAVVHCLPIVFAFRDDAAAGGFASYGANQADAYRRAASYVYRILSGARAGDLPIEQPLRYELVVNLRTARAIGVTVAPGVLAAADEVIE